MYIKKVTKSNKKSSKKYTYLHLVENIRTENGPRQRLILNLGALNIPFEHYKELANSIEGMLTGQTNLLTSQDSEIKKYATDAVSKIINKKAEKKNISEVDLEPEPVHIEKVDINSINVLKARSIGAEHVCHTFWNRLKISSFLKGEGISNNHISLIETLVLGRLISPGSERHTHKWADERSAIYKLSSAPIKYSQRSFYRAAEKLFLHKDALESHLNKSERDLFSLTEKMCFFDLTNTFLEGEANDNPKAKRGRSKEKRSDCKLLTLALIVDEHGFAKYSRLYNGNQSEPDTLKEMISGMTQANPLSSKDRTIVMDAGIASEDNITYLKENGFHYIVVNKGKSLFTDTDMDSFTTIRENNSGGIEVEVTRKENEDEVFLLCRSAGRAEKEKAIRTRQEDLFVERIEYLKNGLIKKGRMKNFLKITESVGKLRSKYPKASKIFEVTVKPEDGSKTIEKQTAIDIIIEKKEPSSDAKTKDGCYVLRSDRMDLADKEIWETYVMLTRIENSFRSMKSSLGLRPIFHQKENSSDAHMFISVIAYHILHAIEFTLRQNNDNRSWATLRDILSTHQFITMEYDEHNSEQGKVHNYITMCTKPEPAHYDIYDKLNISKLPIKKMKIRSDEKNNTSQ